MEELRRIFARVSRLSDLYYLENGINHEELTLTEKSRLLYEFAKSSSDLQQLYKEASALSYTFAEVFPAFTGIIKKGFKLNLTQNELNALEKMKGDFAKNDAV